MTENLVARDVVDVAYRIHTTLGPGLLESIYHTCMIEELTNSELEVKSQLFVPVFYKGKELEGKLKLDLLVNDIIIVELKSVEFILDLHSHSKKFNSFIYANTDIDKVK